MGARRSGRRGLRFAFSKRGTGAVRVDLFQSAVGRRIVGNRLIARFTGRTSSFSWSGRSRKLRDGVLFARLSVRAPSGRTDVRRITLQRRGGRFRVLPAFYRRASCGAISSFKLERPVFGGRGNLAVDASYRLTAAGRVTVDLLRGSRVVRRLSRTAERRGGRTYRVRIPAEGLRRGAHRVRVRVTRGGRTTTAVLTARRL